MKKSNFEKFCTSIEKIRSCEVYGEESLFEDEDDDNLPYVEIGIISDGYINEAKEALNKFGYQITEEHECEGSDYPSYCIWFKERR